MNEKRQDSEKPEHQQKPSATGAPEEVTIIPVVEEELRVGKKEIVKSRVRVSKKVTEHQEEVTVPLNHEEVQVERISINKYVDEAPPAVRHEGDTMIVSVLKEVLVVEKRLMLVEELHIKKKQMQTEETRQETLRKEEVKIKRFPENQSKNGSEGS